MQSRNAVGSDPTSPNNGHHCGAGVQQATLLSGPLEPQASSERPRGATSRTIRDRRFRDSEFAPAGPARIARASAAISHQNLDFVRHESLTQNCSRGM